MGAGSIIAYPFYIQISFYGSVYFNLNTILSITLGGLVILGVILHYIGKKIGSELGPGELKEELVNAFIEHSIYGRTL